MCLDNCDYVAALIPASFLQTGLFQERLYAYILLHQNLFVDTNNPVCLALFVKEKMKKTRIYYDNRYIEELNFLREVMLPSGEYNRQVKFNDPKGELGFISFDSTEKPTIRFCDVKEIDEYDVKQSSRFITRISGVFYNDLPAMIEELNKEIDSFRRCTSDVFLTPFKGMRKDGQYRRRMDFALAKDFINSI